MQDKTQPLPAHHTRSEMAMTTRAATRAAHVQDHTERVLQIATCMAMAGFGEAVACMVRMARAFYGDEVLWAVHKGYKGAQRERTYLMHAAWTGNLARLRFLLARGAAVATSGAPLPSCGPAGLATWRLCAAWWSMAPV